MVRPTQVSSPAMSICAALRGGRMGEATILAHVAAFCAPVQISWALVPPLCCPKPCVAGSTEGLPWPSFHLSPAPLGGGLYGCAGPSSQATSPRLEITLRAMSDLRIATLLCTTYGNGAG